MGTYLFISITILVVCVLLALVVLVQNSKGGGLAANFSSNNQIMGVRKTSDFLEKATWILAIMLLVLSIGSVFTIPSNSEEVNTRTVETSDFLPSSNMPSPVEVQDQSTKQPQQKTEQE